MKRRSLVMLSTLWVALFSSLSASADVVELMSGQRVEGTLRQGPASGVSIEVGGQVITFPRENVRAVYFGPAPKTDAQPSLRDEALRALKGMQSAVQGGISYRDYGPRVTDAKIVVDRYLSDDKLDTEAVKSSIAAAMGYYRLASNFWSEKISNTGGGQNLVHDPLINECEPALAVIRDMTVKLRMGASASAFIPGVALTDNFSPLWSCASSKIAEAEGAAGVK